MKFLLGYFLKKFILRNFDGIHLKNQPYHFFFKKKSEFFCNIEKSSLFIISKSCTLLFQYYSVFSMTLPFDGFPSGLASEYFWSKMKKLLFPILRSKVVSTLRRLRDLPESDQNCSCKEEHMLMSSQRSHISPTEASIAFYKNCHDKLMDCGKSSRFNLTKM